MFEVTAIVAIIVGLVEAAKRTGLNTKYAPILSLGLGLGASLLFGVDDIPTRIFEGIIMGLTASGLYSGTKATIKN